MALTKINTNLIANNTIALTNIADNAIDATKIANNQILARHIAAGSISDQLAAAQPTITSVGTLTTLTVDDITINGSTISDGGDLTLDVAASITLDSDSGVIDFDDGGTNIGRFENASSDFKMESRVQDKDIVLVGNDGGTGVEALRLDMSEGGIATFANDVGLADGRKITFGGAADLSIYHDGDVTNVIRSSSTNHDLTFTGNDDGSMITALTLDMSAAGAAAFNSTVTVETGLNLESGTFTIKNATSDSNGLKIYQAGSDTAHINNHYDGPLVFSQNNTEAMRIDSSARFMVGQNSAYAATGTGTMIGTFTYGANSRTDIAVSNQNSGSSAGAAIALGAYGHDYIIESQSAAKGGSLTFSKSATEQMRIASNVISIKDAARLSLRTTDANTYISAPSANVIAAYTGDTERMRIDSAGDVGIGTNNPLNPLHVKGTRPARFERA